MDSRLVTLWAQKHGQLVLDANIADELREDTLCLAAYLVGPLVIARSFDFEPTRAGRHRPWGETLSPDLAKLPEMLATIGLSAQLPTWGADSPLTPLVPRSAPFILPRTDQGVAMFQCAMTIAELEVAYMFRDDDDDPAPAEVAPPAVDAVHETATAPVEGAATGPLAAGETPRERDDGAEPQATH